MSAIIAAATPPLGVTPLIFSWENTQVAEEVINRGFETILCPGSKTYFDMAYNNSTRERGLNWANTIEAKQIFDWNPEHNIKNLSKQI